MGSATTAVAAWVAAGMPRNKIVLGVASYGYAWRVRKRDAYSYGTTIASNPIFDSNDPAYVRLIIFLKLTNEILLNQTWRYLGWIERHLELQK